MIQQFHSYVYFQQNYIHLSTKKCVQALAMIASNCKEP